MSDVDFGFNGLAGIIFLISLASIALIGFLPGFYFSFKKLKTSIASKVIISIVVGGIFGYLSFSIFSELFSFHVFGDNSTIWYIPIIILFAEIVPLFVDYRKPVKRKKKSLKKK